ncbi:MAG: hypothetical protein CSA89_00110 [Bacteroidales bacterium]|nr:MAG: hypothetical protein CSA89_00110 [Bacteroidales bacterium]
MKILNKTLLTLCLLCGLSLTAQTSYDLKIGGMKINGSADLSNATGVESGSMIYDKDAKTLTLNNVVITHTQYTTYIYNLGIDGFKIILEGTNTITANNAEVIRCLQNTEISGSGSLNINSSENIGIYINPNVTVTIKSTVNIVAGYGIGGADGVSNETLVINNANVKVKSLPGGGSILDLATLTLEGCKIVAPAGAVFNNEKHGVYVGDEKDPTIEEVVIEPSTDKVADIAIPSVSVYPNPAENLIFVETMPYQQVEIYDINGNLCISQVAYTKNISIDIKSLAKGLYIVKTNGTTQKFVKK